MLSASTTKQLNPAFILAIESRFGKLEHKELDHIAHCVSFNNDKQENINLIVSQDLNGDVEIALKPDNSNSSGLIVTPETNYTDLNAFVFELFENTKHKHTSEAHMLSQAIVSACHLA